MRLRLGDLRSINNMPLYSRSFHASPEKETAHLTNNITAKKLKKWRKYFENEYIATLTITFRNRTTRNMGKQFRVLGSLP